MKTPAQQFGLSAFANPRRAEQNQPFWAQRDRRGHVAANVASLNPGCAIIEGHKFVSDLFFCPEFAVVPNSPCNPDRFDQNSLRDLLADGEPRIADKANDVVPASEEFDDPILAKSDLTQAISQFRAGAELTHPDSNAGSDSVQRA
jgi:hypothetical protein